MSACLQSLPCQDPRHQPCWLPGPPEPSDVSTLCFVQHHVLLVNKNTRAKTNETWRIGLGLNVQRNHKGHWNDLICVDFSWFMLIPGSDIFTETLHNKMRHRPEMELVLGPGIKGINEWRDLASSFNTWLGWNGCLKHVETVSHG